MAYFERIDQRTFAATEHARGAWDADTQHVGPSLGLLARAVEVDRDGRRDDALVVARLSYDILGTFPVDAVEVDVRVLRPGRTIELVEATLTHGGRAAVLLRAWLLAPRDTGAVAGSGFAPIPPPEEMEPWDPTTVWAGGFIASAEVRRRQREPGRAAYWARTAVPLVAGEETGPVPRLAALVDIANGMTSRVDPAEAAFPNVDLTLHLHAEPRGDWVGFDTSVAFGTDGRGVTSSTLHDVHGAIGTSSQALTVRPT